MWKLLYLTHTLLYFSVGYLLSDRSKDYLPTAEVVFNNMVTLVSLSMIHSVDLPTESNMIELMLRVFCASVFIDIFFYSLHRLFHTRLLYNNFHRVHHEYIFPVPYSATHAHPFDHFFVNLLPIYLVSLVCGLQYYGVLIFYNIATINTLYSHTLSSYHAEHHKHFNVNYGNKPLIPGLYMDRICRTEY